MESIRHDWYVFPVREVEYAALLRRLLAIKGLASFGGFMFTRCGLGIFRYTFALVQHHLCIAFSRIHIFAKDSTRLSALQKLHSDTVSACMRRP